MDTSTASNIGPITITERIVDLDILRGLALFGILMVNIHYFCAPDAFYVQYFGKFSASFLNDAVFHVVNFLFAGKFYPVFSFLFGLGFFVQFSKLQEKGIRARAFFARRLTILCFLGVMHVLFVWEEDILLFYGLFGFVLIYFVNCSSKQILISAILTYAFVVFVAVFNNAFHFLPPKYSPFGTLESYMLFYRTASYWQILQLRVVLYADKLFTIGGFIHHLDRLAFFLLGLYAGKANLIAKLSTQGSQWARWWGVAFVFGILGQALWLVLPATKPLLQRPISVMMTGFFIPAQVFTYIAGVLLILKMPKPKKMLSMFAFPGRMTLTNYLLGTIIFSLLFNSYGLGLYGRLSPIHNMIVAILFYIFQVIFSKIWLSYYSYGLLEWLWRCATYWKILPLGKPAAQIVLPASLTCTE